MKEDTKVRNVLQFGDFNFPFISWPSKSIYSHEREKKSSEKRQAELLLEFADENFLENCIEIPTRGNNILDMVFSNNHSLINYYKTTVNKRLTDHNLLNVALNFSYNQPNLTEKKKNPYSTKIYEYDSKNADDEDWARFEHYLQQFDENKLENLRTEDQLEMFYHLLEEASETCLKKKKEFIEVNDNHKDDNVSQKRSKNFIPKVVRTLMRKKQKLSQKVLKSKSWEKNYSVMLELEEVEEELSRHYSVMRRREENEAIQKLKSNPKYFYSYQKRFSKTVNTIGDFVKKNGEVITDQVEKAEMLMEQYESVASEPDKDFIVNNAEDFFEVQETVEKKGDEHNSTELLLVEEEDAMPPLSLQEEEESSDTEEEVENEDTSFTVEACGEYNEDEDDNEDDEMAPFLCHKCSLEIVHECREDTFVFREEEDNCSDDQHKCSEDECSEDKHESSEDEHECSEDPMPN